MGLEGRAFQADIHIEDILFLGDTRSADELAVFTNMAPERLCLGCGLRVEEKFTPISLGERSRLFTASVKLLQFALRAVSASAGDKDMFFYGLRFGRHISEADHTTLSNCVKTISHAYFHLSLVDFWVPHGCRMIPRGTNKSESLPQLLRLHLATNPNVPPELMACQR